MPNDKNTCFVIMPFSKTSDSHTEEYWTSFFEKILKPYVEGAGSLEAHRSTALRVDIVRQIISDLVTSDVVVADLTDRNPNVYWELGIRQSFRHGTITIIEEGNKLPFDLSTKGTLMYCRNDDLKMEEFRQTLQHAAKDCLANPRRPDSTVLENITGRGTLFEMFRRDEAIRRLDALLSELNYNKRLIAAHQTMGDLIIQQQLPITRFRTTAIGLLVVNRYLDEDESFFNEAEAYLFLMEFLNEVLATGKEYFAVNHSAQRSDPLPLSITEEFEARLVRIREELISQV